MCPIKEDFIIEKGIFRKLFCKTMLVYIDTNFSRDKKFSLPKSETPCYFGAQCSKPGCPFKHDVQGQNKSMGKEKKLPEIDPETGKAVCKYGDKCKYFHQGTCRNYHPSNNNQRNE